VAQPVAQAGGELPGRRVPGAQLDGLGDTTPEATRAPRDATEVRSQFSAMQSGIAAARREFTPQPLPYEPATTVAESSPVPVRRVRGAQLAELGDDIIPDAPLPARDPAAIRGQLSGLQAATTRARLETAQSASTDDTFGSNA